MQAPTGRDQLIKFKKDMSAGMRTSASLSDYVPFLRDYHSSSSSDLGGGMEIPGQYGGYQRPRPERHARIMCFQDRVRVFTSLRKPVAVGVVGDDGRAFRFIVKCGEDLRQDQRVQQVFAIANR